MLRLRAAVEAFSKQLQAVDGTLFRKLTSNDRRLLDMILPSLTRAADRSMLWIAIAGALALFGGRPGRMAAARGLISIGVVSALVNGPLKLAWRRSRPSGGAAYLIRRPRTFSFPSGHTASAFGFATGVGTEIRPLLIPLGLLAGAVGFSRIHARVHYPSDVLVGAALGIAAGVASGPITRALIKDHRGGPAENPRQHVEALRNAVLVISPNAHRVASSLPAVRKALTARGIAIEEELLVSNVARLPDLIRGPETRLVLAAGGDGTVGAVADQLANSNAILGVLPLGTSNDFARSLGIPIDIDRAVRVLVEGKMSTIDLGRIDVPGQRPRHFVHAATAGLNVNFAKLATRASLRRRLGRLTYVFAAALALRESRPFECRLTYEGRTEVMLLTHLSVINAPVFGGFLGMRVTGSNPDDRLLDILAVEDLSAWRAILAGVYQLFRTKRPLKGVHALHVNEVIVDTDQPLEVALDGEVVGTLPSRFKVAGEALRVMTPQDFEDIDDV